MKICRAKGFWLGALLLVGAVFAPAVFAQAETFVLSESRAPATLNPQQIDLGQGFSTPEMRAFEAQFEGLVEWDPNTGRSLPGLADSWTSADQGKVWTFRLRHAVWSDGSRLTAESVVRSWLHELDPQQKAPSASLLTRFLVGAAAYHEGKASAEAVGVKALGPQTVQLTLREPLVPLGLLALPPFAVINVDHPELVNGPFIADSKPADSKTKEKNTEPQELIFEANPRYWDAQAVKLKTLKFLTLDSSTAWKEYQAGKVDWATEIPTSRLGDAELREDFQNVPGMQTYFYIPIEKPEDKTYPLNDERVRKALSLAIDRTLLVRQVLKLGVFPFYSVSPPFWDYQPPECAHDNIMKAQELLASAGYGKGAKFPALVLGLNKGGLHEAVASYVVSQWQANLGIKVTLKTVSWKDFQEGLAKGTYDLARGDWRGDWPDPLAFLETWSQPDNAAQFHSKTYDQLIAEARLLPDGTPRLKKLAAAEELLLKRQVVIPLFCYGSPQLIDQTRWNGWFNNTADLHPWKFIQRAAQAQAPLVRSGP
ncbi:MAG: peptide ABC transporter substrate-binding protein [Spirochaetales bacterium]|nr:peptide ABC transporter substrate-binding protein [Spirochaetales bacterium]